MDLLCPCFDVSHSSHHGYRFSTAQHEGQRNGGMDIYQGYLAGIARVNAVYFIIFLWIFTRSYFGRQKP